MFGLDDTEKLFEFEEEGWYLPLAERQRAHYLIAGTSLCGKRWLLGAKEGKVPSSRCTNCERILEGRDLLRREWPGGKKKGKVDTI